MIPAVQLSQFHTFTVHHLHFYILYLLKQCIALNMCNFYYSPYVYFFRHRLISYHFWRHPGHRARKRHLCTFVTELFGRPKVRDFHSVIVGDQNTKTDTNRRHTHTC